MSIHCTAQASERAPDAASVRLKSQRSLPVIDIGPMFQFDLRQKIKVAHEIGEAARKFGFFYICNHGITQAETEAVYRQAELFFSLPRSQKNDYYIGDSRNHRGYVPVTETGDYADEKERHYEAFDLALDLPETDPDYLAGNQLLGPNVWPELPEFQKRVKGYYEGVALVGQTLCRAFELHLNLKPGYLDQFMQKPTSQLRLLHYLEHDITEETEVETDVTMGAHSDYECFTILHQRVAGLQVLGHDNRWIQAPPIPGTYVINIGDMLETWTNGAFKSTLHRVVNNGRERFSLPFFVAADYDAVIKPLDSVVSKYNPARYKRIVAGEHLLGMLLRDFGYLKKRYDNGLIDLKTDTSATNNPFEARLEAASR